MIHISEQAATQINRLRSETPKASGAESASFATAAAGAGASDASAAMAAPSFLRVKVVAGGCSGMSYKLDFDQTIGEKDRVFEEHGTKVVVDSKSLLYIAGMTLDFEGGLNGKGFVFSNPNASKTCGCGSSFGV